MKGSGVVLTGKFGALTGEVIEVVMDGNSRKPEKKRIMIVKNSISVIVQVLRGFNCMMKQNFQLGLSSLSLRRERGDFWSFDLKWDPFLSDIFLDLQFLLVLIHLLFVKIGRAHV